VRRRGRLTDGQAKALRDYGEQFVLSENRPLLTWENGFRLPQNFGVEIGFGTGDFLISWGKTSPDWNLVGIDIYRPGIGSLLRKIIDERITNIRVLEMDARIAFLYCFEEASIDEVRIYFPDPWPKKRHHKRRIIQPEFISLLALAIKPGGHLFLATDWWEYADWMRQVIGASPEFSLLHPYEIPNPSHRLQPTKFEARGLKLGHKIVDLAYQRKR